MAGTSTNNQNNYGNKIDSADNNNTLNSHRLALNTAYTLHHCV